MGAAKFEFVGRTHFRYIEMTPFDRERPGDATRHNHQSVSAAFAFELGLSGGILDGETWSGDNEGPLRQVCGERKLKHAFAEHDLARFHRNGLRHGAEIGGARNPCYALRAELNLKYAAVERTVSRAERIETAFFRLLPLTVRETHFSTAFGETAKRKRGKERCHGRRLLRRDGHNLSG